MRAAYTSFFLFVCTLSASFGQDVSPVDLKTLKGGPLPLHDVEAYITRGKELVDVLKKAEKTPERTRQIEQSEAMIKHLERQRDHIQRARGAWKEFDKRLTFPCDLKKMKSLPKIVLQGDNHNDPKCKDAVCQLVQKGAGGQCHVGIENVLMCKFGLLDDDDLRQRFKVPKEKVTKDSRTSGFDDAFTHGFGMLVRADIIGHSIEALKTKDAAIARGTPVAEIAPNQFLAQTLATVEKNKAKLGKDEQEILKFFVDNQKTAIADIAKNIRALGEDHPLRSNGKAYANVLHAWMRAYVDLALSDDVKDKALTPPNLREIVEEHINRTDIMLPIQVAVVEWRNRFLAKNIGELYCEAAKEEKTLQIVVGNWHLHGLRELLTQMGGEGGPPIEVVRPR